MNLLITDATIVTCDVNRRIIDRGAIAIADDRIAAGPSMPTGAEVASETSRS